MKLEVELKEELVETLQETADENLVELQDIAKMALSTYVGGRKTKPPKFNIPYQGLLADITNLAKKYWKGGK